MTPLRAATVGRIVRFGVAPPQLGHHLHLRGADRAREAAIQQADLAENLILTGRSAEIRQPIERIVGRIAVPWATTRSPRPNRCLLGQRLHMAVDRPEAQPALVELATQVGPTLRAV